MPKELNKFVIGGIAIIILAIIVLVGTAVVSNFSKVLRTDTTVNASSTAVVTTLAAPNSSNLIGTAGTYPFLQSLTLCGNTTNITNPSSSNQTFFLDESFYSITEGTTDGGYITLNQDGLVWAGATLNCSSVGYLADSNAQGVADNFSTGLAVFGTFAVIIVLAIVGKAIIALFRKND